MLQDLMNMEGVAVLSKQQQSGINGGDACVVTYGDGSQLIILHGSEISPQDQSNDANNECVGSIVSGQQSSCSYDCGHDGWGQ